MLEEVCMVGHVKLKGFQCEEVYCWTSGTKDLYLKKCMVWHVKQRHCA
jgi:hypothetical protein